MKKILCALFCLTVLSLMPVKSFAADENVGLGIIIGEPTGFTGKMWWNDTVAFDGGLAWSFTDDENFNIHSDVLWHNWNVLQEAFEINTGRLPLYYGFGGRLKISDDSRLGVRFVIGVSYMFDDAPIDIFGEMAPVMDIAPETTIRMNAGIGARIWF